METQSLVLLTIVAEHVLRERLIVEVQAAGARGYTVYEVDGEGSRHRRVSDVLGANVKLETIVSTDVAAKLMSVLAKEYFPRYAVVAHTSIVNVIRGEKYA